MLQAQFNHVRDLRVGKIMEDTVERKRATKPRKRALSPAEQELKAMKDYVKKISGSKEQSIAFLQRAGILDKKGELTKPYRA